MENAPVPLSQIPAAQPPAGQVSNFDNPSSLRSPTIAVNASLLSIASIVVGLRLHTKHFLLRQFGWDDLTCLLALLASAANSGLTIYAVQCAHLGQHMWDIPVSELVPQTSRNNTAVAVTYAPAIFLVKLSVFLLLYRVFGVNPTVRYLIYFGIGFQALYGSSVIIVYSVDMAKCIGVMGLTSEFCKNLWIFSIVQGVLNLVTDIYILALPVGVVLSLQMNHTRRLGVLTVFSVGMLAIAASLARLIISAVTLHDTDLLWGACLTGITGTVEMYIGLVCACMPTMPASFKAHKFGVPALRGWYSGKKSEGSTSSAPLQPDSTPFRAINVHITHPSLHLQTGRYTELESLPEREASLVR